MKNKCTINFNKFLKLATLILIFIIIISVIDLILSNGQVMSKYVLTQLKPINVNILIDIEKPLIEMTDTEGNNINNENSKTYSSVTINKIYDSESGIKSAVYRYNIENDTFDNIEAKDLKDGMTFEDIGNYEIIVTDNAGNIRKVKFSIVKSENIETEFITEWTLPENNTTIMLPIDSIPEITIDWGDGTQENVKSINPTHKYLNKGVYDIKITGSLPSWNTYSYSPSTADNREYVTAVKQWGEVGLKNMERAFAFCRNLKYISEPSMNSFKDVNSFKLAFYGCVNLTDIPSKIFRNCSKVTSFYHTFMNDKGLTTIPLGLFDDCINVTNFEGTFNNCSGLTGDIPKGLFENCSKVITFDNTFTNCTGLNSIPKDLFSNCTEATSFSATFFNCSGLITIPEDLFDNINKCNTSTFLYTFQNCTGLTKISINSALIGSKMFYGCSNLTDITIGNNVSSIIKGAFHVDSNLNTVLNTSNKIAEEYEWSYDNRTIIK